MEQTVEIMSPIDATKLRLHHVGITVSDWDRAMEFYCGVLGLEVVFDAEFDCNPEAELVHGIPNARYRLAHLAVPSDLGGGTIELFHFSNPKGRKVQPCQRVCDHGWTHTCFVTSDIDATYRRLSSKGVKFTTPPVRVGSKGITFHQGPRTATAPVIGKVKGTYFYDPDGMILELIEL